MKKLFSVLLITVMLLAMSASAFAAGDGTITVTNPVAGETYTIYRMLDLESFSEDKTAYSYKANSAWEAWLRTQTEYLSFDGQGYVTWVGGDSAAAFAKAAQAYAEANDDINPVEIKTAGEGPLVFSGLELGYYLVDTSLGSLCSLDTTAKDAKVTEKNSTTDVVKKVEEDSNNEWGDSDDANIGQIVNFKTTVTIKYGAEDYILHDILSDGLTRVDDSISIDGLVEGTDYTVALDQDCTGKDGNAAVCDFHIVFDQKYLDTITKDTDVVVSYAAYVNEKAVVGLPGNPNDTRLQYSTDNYTEWDETITYTWDMKVLKYDGVDEVKKPPLANAKFVLLNSDKTKVAIFNGNFFARWIDVPAEGAWPEGTERVTDSDGRIEITGIDSDTYYLRETKAPDGYNKLAEDVEVVITGATKGEGTTLEYETVEAQVANKTGTVLPHTGAMGTRMFITIGSMFVMIAVVFMVTRKKMSIYQD